MGKPIGPKKVQRYTQEFKVQAVRLSLSPDFQTQGVAQALDITVHALALEEGEWVIRAP